MAICNSDTRMPSEIFLWHTFGDHGEETEAEIINRKKSEIKNSESGHTFWTFGMQTEGKMLDNWRDQLMRQSKGGFAYVVCGGKASKPSGKEGSEATHYTENLIRPPSNPDSWEEIPKSIAATRAKLGTQYSAAFVVSDIQTIGEKSELTVKWWNQKYQNWVMECPLKHARNGVKLLHKSTDGKTIVNNADCRHILTLKYPYFVLVGKT